MKSGCTLIGALGLAALCCGIGVSSVQANLVFTDGEVGAFTNGSVGFQGSSSGVQTDDPADVGGFTGGFLGLNAGIEAGPVPPGTIVTLPGTTLQVTADSTNFIDATIPNAVTVSTTTSTQVTSPGEGIYQASAQGRSQVDFQVTEETEFEIDIDLAVGDAGPTWIVRLLGGSDAFILNGANFTADGGNETRTGTLVPGTAYRLLVSTNVNLPTGVTSENSSLVATLVIPEPASAALLLLTAPLAMMRRR